MTAAIPWKALFVVLPTLAVLLALVVPVSEMTQWSTSLFSKQIASPTTHVLSHDPLVVYIKNFITPEEAAHLVRLAEGGFENSPLYDNAGKRHFDKAYRSSLTAKLPKKDDVVLRLEERARAFPFYKHEGDFQQFVVQNYGIAGQYRDHFDWYDDAHAIGGNIASTFFVYIHANCTGGGTNFPRLEPPEDEAWCEFVDCDRPIDEGVTFKPILGNAVYWENLHENDAGNLKTLHAGMPVTSGNKMGLNMWTWKTA